MVPPEEKRRVVLVEDDTRLARLISAYLQQQGFIVEAHLRAEPALDSIAAAQPDVVILDIVLPDMDGFAAGRAIRAHYRVAWCDGERERVGARWREIRNTAERIGT
jgi:DNA-binding response OmpR family regulator